MSRPKHKVHFHCVICQHRWTDDVEPDAKGDLKITEDICPKCEAQADVEKVEEPDVDTINP